MQNQMYNNIVNPKTLFGAIGMNLFYICGFYRSVNAFESLASDYGDALFDLGHRILVCDIQDIFLRLICKWKHFQVGLNLLFTLQRLMETEDHADAHKTNDSFTQ